jgi:hypothetical protein
MRRSPNSAGTLCATGSILDMQPSQICYFRRSLKQLALIRRISTASSTRRPHAEFLYACVRQTIEHDLPNKTRFLQNFDRFRFGIENMFDMPERTLNNLFGFLRQNDERLSRRAR